jgi:uncharacterized RDD family membrane protein YckC
MSRPFDHLLWGTITSLIFLISCSEVLSALFNKKRRALHDFIAGTVVVKSKIPSGGGAFLAVAAAIIVVGGSEALLKLLKH